MDCVIPRTGNQRAPETTGAALFAAGISLVLISFQRQKPFLTLIR